MTTTGALISTRELTRTFGSGDRAVTAVKSVSLDVFTGEFLAVVGRSGSGKTTLLNLMAGLDRATTGSVVFEGAELTSMSDADLTELRKRSIGFVFQSFGLMPLLSAYENVELPLHIRGVGWRERRRRAHDVLESVGLGSRARHRPYELSGGEQQRVAIARALAPEPQVIFADEPTGELDTQTAMTIGSILGDVVGSQVVTVIVATHDLAIAELSSRTIELVDGSLVSDSAAPAARKEGLERP